MPWDLAKTQRAVDGPADARPRAGPWYSGDWTLGQEGSREQRVGLVPGAEGWCPELRVGVVPGAEGRAGARS